MIDNKVSTEQLQVLIFKDKSNVPVRFLKKFAKLEPQLVGSENNVEEVEAYLYALQRSYNYEGGPAKQLVLDSNSCEKVLHVL